MTQMGKCREVESLRLTDAVSATKTVIAERAKGIRKVAIPIEGKSVKCRANKSTGDESSANRGIAPKHKMANSSFTFNRLGVKSAR